MIDRQINNRVHATSVVVMTLLASTNLCAAPNAGPASLPIGSTELLNVGGGLIFVVFAIIVLGIIYAKTQGLRPGTNGVIKVVATQALGPKERLAIIEIADKQLLIGMTTSSVQTLHVFDQPVAIDSESAPSFSARFKSMMKGESE